MAHDPKGLRWGVLGTAAIARVVIAASPRRFRAVAGRAPRRTTSFARRPVWNATACSHT